MARKTPRASLETRRGLFKDDSGNSWYMTLVQVPGRTGPVDLDALVDALIAGGVVSEVRRDIGEALHADRVAVPSGRWALLASIRGQPWAYFLPGSGDDYGLAADLARRSGLRALGTGYQDTASATVFRCYEGAETLVDFETCGLGGDDDDDWGDDESALGTRFGGTRHPAAWIRRFRSESRAVEALAKDLDAFVPFIGPAEHGDVLGIYGYDRAEFEPVDYFRIDLLGYPGVRFEPTEADRSFRDALQAGDPAAIRSAAAAGANVLSIPGRADSPIREAIRPRRGGIAAAREMISTLLDLGVPADAPGEEPSILAAFDIHSQDQAAAIGVLEVLLDGGADVNARGIEWATKGRTPLHVAAGLGKVAIVKFLISRGGDLAALDSAGLTPRQAERAQRDRVRAMFPDDPAFAGTEEVAEILAAAEAGRADLDWQPDAEGSARDARRRRAALNRGFAEVGTAIRALGAVMAEEPAPGAVVDAAVVSQPDQIALVPDPDGAWFTESARRRVSRILRAEGFGSLGRYAIPALPAIRLEAFHDPISGCYGVVYDALGRSFVDLIRHHVNMTRLTVTNSRTRPEAQFSTPNHRVIRLPGAALPRLLAALRADVSTVPTVSVDPDPAADFVRRFESAYRQDIKARRRAIRRTQANKG